MSDLQIFNTCLIDNLIAHLSPANSNKLKYEDKNY
jgi:hypothetical protein